MKTYVRTLGLTLAVSMAACGRNPEPAPAPPPPAPQPVATRPQPDNSAAQREAEERARREREAEMARLRSTLAEMVFFDYDRSEIRADARAVLDRKTRILRDQPTVRIRIEGHADERGSTEYNLALGSRRAAAVRDYITAAGIQASRLETVSFGEERPLERARSEAAFSRNRRAEFAVTAGALMADR